MSAMVRGAFPRDTKMVEGLKELFHTTYTESFWSTEIRKGEKEIFSDIWKEITNWCNLQMLGEGKEG